MPFTFTQSVILLHILIVPDLAVSITVDLVVVKLHGGVFAPGPLPREWHGHREEDAEREHKHYEHLDHAHEAMALLLSVEHRVNLLGIQCLGSGCSSCRDLINLLDDSK